MKAKIDKYLINLILYWRNLMKSFDSEPELKSKK